MKNDALEHVWLFFVHIKPMPGYRFVDLIDLEDQEESAAYIGAWCHALVVASSIKEATEIMSQGFKEKMFAVEEVDSVNNFAPMLANNEVNQKIIDEVMWLLSTDFVFLISDKLFPYTEE